ncbi:MAG TPA: hypothetical protein VN852_01090 [Candidatus Krumholzibacteria bacterium]|nr:hypothetical protein [Candidatus Krumholzibacteria bacterium]
MRKSAEPRRRGPRCMVACALVLGAALSHAADAQVPGANRALEFEDLGYTRPPEISARAAGLGGYVATATDVTALVTNPGLLCRIKQRTPMLGFSHESSDVVTSYPGSSMGLSSDRNGLQFVGAAAAIPVFQGSLVPAVAVYRAVVSDLDIAYQTTRPAELRTDSFRLQQSGTTYAFAAGFGIDLASVLSAGVSVSLMEGGYQALRQTHTRTETSPNAVDEYVIDDIDGDLDGVVAHVGFILYAHRHAHIAFNVTTPSEINASVTQSSENTQQIENGTGFTVRESTSSSAEYVVPYRLDGGIAMPWGAWLVAVQAGTCDWAASAIDGQRLRLQNGSAVLGRTIDYRAGVEWTAPSWPVRLRAGAARLPFAPDYLQADRIDNDQMEKVSAESAPMRYSFGAGVILRESIVIDASFMHTRGDRNTTSFSEERNGSQFLIEGSYWF